ncbi:MAG TPA: efflux RND transporter periplasmic adaptor subunit [Chitinophagaceae bacterium]
MQKILKVVLFASSVYLTSCSAKTDSGDKNGALAQKKAKLEELKKQQANLSQEITALQAEVEKLDPSAKAEKAKLISVSAITPESFTHYIDLQGSITAEDISYVAPRNGQGGLVKAVYVKQGDYVKKGQLLLKLDDAILLKNLKQAQTDLAYLQDMYNRQKNLWDQQIGTEQQLIDAKQKVDQAENQIATIKEQWNMTNVYADVSGVADAVNIRVGEMFTGVAGQTPQIRIVNNTRLKVTAQVPENYLGRVKEGSKMVVNLPDLGKTIKTTVSVAGKIIDLLSRSFYVEAKLPSDKDLKPNQIALVKIEDYTVPKAITIPVNTLQTDEKGKFVLVAVNENGKLVARKKPVQIGELYGDKLEIKNGLQTGDQVITEGYQGLYDGQLITTSAS